MFRSLDGGKNWTNLTGQLPVKSSMNAVLSIILHPTDPKTIYILVNRVGVEISTDGGDNWALLGKPPAGDYPDLWGMAVSFKPKLMLLLNRSTPAGIWRFEAEISSK